MHVAKFYHLRDVPFLFNIALNEPGLLRKRG
jgi:hypothetical protein